MCTHDFSRLSFAAELSTKLVYNTIFVKAYDYIFYNLLLLIHCSLRGVLTFVASGLDINDCVLGYFEGTENLHFYTRCTLTTLHCSKVSFLQCCHMEIYNKIFTHFCEILYIVKKTKQVYFTKNK